MNLTNKRMVLANTDTYHANVVAGKNKLEQLGIEPKTLPYCRVFSCERKILNHWTTTPTRCTKTAI